eukprot:TRINITY_DN62835_c0_g1_i1.p1 TRINITY_DN62835_c0_g1~~TRINITY_DN62835_c0_g1_i1.p1  ORF type:complete len:257 (-),score=22.87 TRINITY_DN62835_c0_g1_i1:230-925(-)
MAPSPRLLVSLGVLCALVCSSAATEDSCRQQFGYNRTACSAAASTCAFSGRRGCVERRSHSRRRRGGQYRDRDGTSSGRHGQDHHGSTSDGSVAAQGGGTDHSQLRGRGERDRRGRRGVPWAVVAPVIAISSLVGCCLVLLIVRRCRSKSTQISSDEESAAAAAGSSAEASAEYKVDSPLGHQADTPIGNNSPVGKKADSPVANKVNSPVVGSGSFVIGYPVEKTTSGDKE